MKQYEISVAKLISMGIWLEIKCHPLENTGGRIGNSVRRSVETSVYDSVSRSGDDSWIDTIYDIQSCIKNNVNSIETQVERTLTIQTELTPQHVLLVYTTQ